MRNYSYILILVVLLTSSLVFSVSDEDADGIPNNNDKCINSDTIIIDMYGCDCKQKTKDDCIGDWCCSDGCIGFQGSAVCNYQGLCSETDTGNDIFIKGITTQDDKSEEDYCIDENNLMEMVLLRD